MLALDFQDLAEKGQHLHVGRRGRCACGFGGRGISRSDVELKLHVPMPLEGGTIVSNEALLHLIPRASNNGQGLQVQMRNIRQKEGATCGGAGGPGVRRTETEVKLGRKSLGRTLSFDA